MTTTTEQPTTALAMRGLSDKQIQTRIDLNRKAGYGLEKASPPQLNLIFLYCQKYQLLPGDDVTLYENKPWLTLLGTVKLMRRHDEYRGFECKPLSAAAKAEWGYDPDDVVVECQIRTSTWGTISARGKVSKEEIAGIRIEGRRLNYVASIHPVEMAEKRAIQRAERLAFGADAMIDEDEIENTARIIIEERDDPETIAANSAMYDRITPTEAEMDRASDPPSGKDKVLCSVSGCGKVVSAALLKESQDKFKTAFCKAHHDQAVEDASGGEGEQESF